MTWVWAWYGFWVWVVLASTAHDVSSTVKNHDVKHAMGGMGVVSEGDT
jgi:hypothetical protein